MSVTAMKQRKKKADIAFSSWGPKDLKSKREEIGMKPSELANHLGVTHRQYSYYESGHTKISKGLELAVLDLLGGDKKSQGTLTDFEKLRITKLLNAIENHPLDDLNERTQKILQQSKEEMVLLLSKLGN